MEKITLCGDNCLYCPRYLAKSDEELKKTAQLWYKVGWRDTIVSNDEIRCTGCSSHKKCTYELVDCLKEKSLTKCNQCSDFPCQKITSMLKRTSEYKQKCKNLCSPQEFQMLDKAFFNK